MQKFQCLPRHGPHLRASPRQQLRPERRGHRHPNARRHAGCKVTIYRVGRSPHWVKVKNPNAPAVTRRRRVGASRYRCGQPRSGFGISGQTPQSAQPAQLKLLLRPRSFLFERQPLNQGLTTSRYLVGRLLGRWSGKTVPSGRPFLMDRRRTEPMTAVPRCKTSRVAWAWPHAVPSRRPS